MTLRSRSRFIVTKAIPDILLVRRTLMKWEGFRFCQPPVPPRRECYFIRRLPVNFFANHDLAQINRAKTPNSTTESPELFGELLSHL
ncbi:MAG: hypothetical protein PHE53_07335 [Thermoguttaceae bacterium]|nr:hypothetical protein [Thermoguttaceae bacterium]